jgi:hypothetical protein
VFTIFIVPGDIGSEVDRIEAVLRNLVNNYDAVCYLPGTTVARCECCYACSMQRSSGDRLRLVFGPVSRL